MLLAFEKTNTDLKTKIENLEMLIRTNKHNTQ